MPRLLRRIIECDYWLAPVAPKAQGGGWKAIRLQVGLASHSAPLPFLTLVMADECDTLKHCLRRTTRRSLAVEKPHTGAETSAGAIALRFGFSVFMLFVALNLPWRFGEFASETVGEISESNSTLHLRSVAEINLIRCGWPLVYAEVVSSPLDSSESLRWLTWSGASLFGNLTIAMIAAVILACLAYVSRYFAVVTIGLAALILANSWHQAFRHDQALAQTLAPEGVVYRTAFLPIRLARIMPHSLLTEFSRIRGVMLFQPTDENLSLVTSIPTLQSIGLRGKLPALENFSGLITQPRLRQLTLINVTLAPAHVDLIGKQSDLQYLSLISCRGLRGSLKKLQDLPMLNNVDLSSSEFDIDALTDNQWSRNVKDLVVSPQLTGNNQLCLEDWLVLESLTVRSNRRGVASDVMKVSVERMPQLRSLSLISTQKIDLSIVNSPRLKDIRIDDGEEQFIGLTMESAPTSLWLDKLRLDNVASLGRVACYGMDLQRIEINEAPNLIELSIDAALYARKRFQKHPSDQKQIISQIIQDLGNCDGPHIISLSTLPLADIDLQPLAKNHRIRELRLSATGVSGSQLDSLLALPRLSSLDLRSCPISNEQAESMLNRLPLLKELMVDANDFQRIEVVDREQLVQFTTTPVPAASIVRIQRSPNLSTELILGDKLKELSITDARSLRGLSVDGPLPVDATLEGFRDLRYCALGGANVDDRMCAAIWYCPKLDHLTLAHTSLSQRSLVQIGELKELSTLIVPGSDIDDSVTANWRELKQLSEVDFSYTNISRETFRFLMSLKNLQRLAINHVSIDRRDLQPLVGISQLIELEVAGVGLEDDLLEALLSRGMLDRLELSDCELSGRAVSILASPVARSLVFLGLRDCGLTEDEVQRILDGHSHLVVDAAGHSLSDGFIDKLQRENRLVRRQDRASFLRHVGRFNQAGMGGGETIKDTIPGRIDVHRFMPPGQVSTL